MKRLAPHVFKVPIERIRAGYYSDKYFTRFVDILRRDKKHQSVIYQFFPRADSVIAGLDEACAILRCGTGYYTDVDQADKLFQQLLKVEDQIAIAEYQLDRKGLETGTKERIQLREALMDLWVDKWDELEVSALYDGDKVRFGEPVLVIKGDPVYFGYLETLLLGVIARATSTATSVKRVVDAAQDKPIIFFSARFDHHWVQTTDGYAAFKAGAFGVSTDANADYWGAEALGTIPHALIASYQGSSSKAAMAFDEHIPPEVNRVILVDWDNDCVGTSLRVIGDFYKKFTGKDFIPGLTDPSPVIGQGKNKIWGVRLDTSGSLRDKSVIPHNEDSLGVCPELVWRVRERFDQVGLDKVKIMVSGGFDEKKIGLFERLGVPVDLYGVGSKLLKSKVDVTADIVEVDGRPCAKIGRKKGDYSRLHPVALNGNQ
ncbi:MAG: nicotinate phosphoribosyltransferase [Firmicutes bacterium]|nr:nicotinate phosphoribosyltransferase [Bacillota bacterium]